MIYFNHAAREPSSLERSIGLFGATGPSAIIALQGFDLIAAVRRSQIP